ncbi:MAG TPA: hypothetical protein VMG82_12205 [Candidatus Sulfotelmatobacter sp.]|nr:hypothetical protein [Candidatus Sulfotelmatobacter sp.]
MRVKVRLESICLFEEFVSDNLASEIMNHKGTKRTKRTKQSLKSASFVRLGVLRNNAGCVTTEKPPPFHNVGMTVRRMKTYSSAQGYVYEYYFVGKRAALPEDPEAPATEFIFDVTSDRKLTYSVSIFLAEAPLAAWSKAHGRRLNDAEQYAAVKMRLFRAFDELEDVKAKGRRLSLDAASLEEALATLGIE